MAFAEQRTKLSPCAVCGGAASPPRKDICNRCYGAAYRERNRKRLTQVSYKWQANNREKHLAARRAISLRRYYALTPEQRRERERKRQKRSTSNRYREYQRLYQSQRRAKKTGVVTPEQWKAILKAYSGRCVYCGIGGKMTMDHVEPISRGGLHVPSNIVPACLSCNSGKCDRPPPVLPAVRLMI